MSESYNSNQVASPQQWVKDCIKWRSRVLTGDYGHYCFDWDGLPVDETCDEWPCTCFPQKRTSHGRHPSEATVEAAARGICHMLAQKSVDDGVPMKEEELWRSFQDIMKRHAAAALAALEATPERQADRAVVEKAEAVVEKAEALVSEWERTSLESLSTQGPKAELYDAVVKLRQARAEREDGDG